MRSQALRCVWREGKNEKYIRQVRRTFRKRITVQQVRAEQFVQALETGVVLRNTDVEQLRAPAEFDAHHGKDTIVGSEPHEVGNPGGVVDVRERERPQTRFLRLFQQVFGRHYAMVEAEPAVAIEEHFSRDDDKNVDPLAIK
jgi:hypothetical protein